MLSGMTPWADGVDEALDSDCNTTGAEWKYLLSYELLTPLRNAVMFKPDTVVNNETNWERVSRVYVDCKIKNTTGEAD